VDSRKRPFDAGHGLWPWAVAQGRPEQAKRVEGRPLKILHVDPERLWGGGERQVVGLLNYLSRWGHASHLLCLPDGALAREARAIGTTVYPLKLVNDLDLRPVLRVRRLIRDQRYDVVHFHTKRAHALCAWLGGARRGSKRVVTRRMDYPMRRGCYDRYLYNRAVDGVIAISQRIAALLVAGGVDEAKIRVIYSGVDPEPFENIPPSTGDGSAVVIGTVAALEERKGHRFLLEAAVKLKRQGHRLRYRIAGDGSEKESLKNLARALGIEEEVEFLGFVSDVPAFLSSIDVFVLPSLFEGLGVAALEAMAAAKPVVATNVGGLGEIVAHEKTGLLAPPADSSSLARAIAEMVSRRDRMREMGKNGRARVREHFTMEQMAKKNESYYYELLEDRATNRVQAGR
jgi:glycosyltransferase involved in cell wall biosynthesis